MIIATGMLWTAGTLVAAFAPAIAAPVGMGAGVTALMFTIYNTWRG